MSELSMQELVEFGKVLHDFQLGPDEVALAHVRRARQIVDCNIALLGSATQPERAQPDAVLVDLESVRDAIFDVHVALSEQGEESSSPGLTRLINETASLHDKVNLLCWLIGENQADQDTSLPGSFSSADDLFKAMGV